MRWSNHKEVWLRVAFISFVPHVLGQVTRTAIGCPELNSSLTLDYGSDVSGSTALNCILSQPPANDIEVQVLFRIEGEISQWFRIIVNPNMQASITATEMNTTLYDKKIYCSATARFFVWGAQWCSRKIVSNTLHVTMKMQTSLEQIEIWEGQPNKTVNISFTAPPSAFCKPEDQGNCRVEIITALTTSSNEIPCPYREIVPQAVLGVDIVGQDTRACGVILSEENWRNEMKIPIKATLDRRRDSSQERELKVMVKISSLVTNETSVLGQHSIKVRIYDNDVSWQCSVYTDPHLMTFDKRSDSYHIPGEFILYKHRQLEYEVRAIHEVCHGRSVGPTCNQAVAIRSEDDVISFTKGTRSGVSVKMYRNGELTPGTRIHLLDSGKIYEVLLPHGTVVTVKYVSGQFFNIYIKPSSTDVSQTEGICGNFNGIHGDDFDFLNVNDFAMKWKCNDTIFTGVPAQNSTMAPVYCSCQENHLPRCAPNLDGFSCLTSPFYVIDITNLLIEDSIKPQFTTRQRTFRRKRALPDSPTPENGIRENGTTEWTLESARIYCANFLNSAEQVKICSDHLDRTDTPQSIEDCAFDISALGNTEWALSNMDRLIDACLTSVTRDVRKWTKSSNGTIGPPSELVDSICPLDCGTHGKCKNGVCKCSTGWTGEQCNIGADIKPDVFPADEACDLLTSVSSCRVVGVEGDKFVPTSNLTCVFQFIEVSESKILNVAQPETVDAMYVSQYKVTCEQPDTGDQARSAFVAISNNGGRTTSADRHLHVVHRSSCEQCEMTEDGRGVMCVSLPDSCHIDGRCYLKYERYKEDACYWCDPGNRKYNWTVTSESTCQSYEDKEEESKDEMPIVFIVLGVVLVLALIVTIVAVIKWKRKKSQGSLTMADKTDEDNATTALKPIA